MSLNIRALKDAVARWQTYEDRGITPHTGWGEGGDGNSCALGDIAHYEKIKTSTFLNPTADRENAVGDELGFRRFVRGELVDGFQGLEIVRTNNTSACHFAAVNDREGRWPIEEVQRLIEWEEASIMADNIADVEQPIFA